MFPKMDKKIIGQDLNSIIDEEIDFDPRLLWFLLPLRVDR